MQIPKSSAPAEPEPIERWTAQRKAAIILEVLKGQILVPEAARKYRFTQGDYRKWTDEFMRGGTTAASRQVAVHSNNPMARHADGDRVRAARTSRRR